MNVFYQDLIGKHQVRLNFAGETFYFLNDSKKISFYLDPKCQKRYLGLENYVKITSFFSSCFCVDSAKPFEIVLKVRISKEQKLLQILDVFNKSGNKITNRICRDYLKNVQPFDYGEYFLCSNKFSVLLSEKDFDDDLLDDFVDKKHLRDILIAKVSKILGKDNLFFSSVRFYCKGVEYVL